VPHPRRNGTILLWLAFLLGNGHSAALSVVAVFLLLAGLALRRSAPAKRPARRRAAAPRPRSAVAPPSLPHPLGPVIAPTELTGLREAHLDWRRTVLEPCPASREQVEEALRCAYEFANQPVPPIRWVGSPRDLFADRFPGIAAAGVLARVSGPYRPGGTTRLPGPCSLDEYMGEPFLRQTPTGRAIDQAFGQSADWNVFEAVWIEARARGRSVPVTSAESMVPRVAKAEFIARSTGLDLAAWRPHITLAREGCAYVIGNEAAYACDRHTILRTDGEGRLHSIDGPAVEWADGFAVYAWHGRHVNRGLFERRHWLSLADIAAASSEQHRSLLLDLFGYERLVQEGPAAMLDDDACGTLWQVTLPGTDVEAVSLVEVVNATPEPDGERRRFFLRVPPRMQRAQDAVAWTFGLTEQQWQVAAES
jgi:hypothetical protein